MSYGYDVRGVIERLQFLFESACSNVQVVNDVVWQRIPNVCSAIGKTTLCKASSHTRVRADYELRTGVLVMDGAGEVDCECRCNLVVEL